MLERRPSGGTVDAVDYLFKHSIVSWQYTFSTCASHARSGALTSVPEEVSIVKHRASDETLYTLVSLRSHQGRWAQWSIGVALVVLVAGCSSAVGSDSQKAPQLSTASPHVRLIAASVKPCECTVTIESVSTQRIHLGGWALEIGGTRMQLPMHVVVIPHRPLTIHTAAGESTPTDIYLGEKTQPLASQFVSGAVIYLMNPSGEAVSSYTLPARQTLPT
jgi:hypothetical protein